MSAAASGSRALIPRLVLLALLVGATGLAFQHRELLHPSALQGQIGSLGRWAPAAFVALFALATVLFIPGSLFGFAGGFLFGPTFGTVWNLLGATIGATLAFLAARNVASDWVARRAGGRLQQLLDGVQAEGWRFVALMRLVPLVPFNLLNYALGLTRIRVADYTLTTLVCMAPGAAAYAWLGHAGREAAAGGAAALNHGVLGLALLALVLFLPRLIGRLRANSGAWTSVAEMRQRLDAGADVQILDVRDPDEFAGPNGYIQGARNLPLPEMTARLNELASAEPRSIVLVCKTHKRSARAANLLREAGFSDVRVLRGAMEAWRGEASSANTSSIDTPERQKCKPC